MTFIIYSLILFVSWFFFAFLGYGAHWFLHQEFSGPFYRIHFSHHYKQYPPNDMFSIKYRSSGKDNSIVLFGILFSPVVLGMLAMTIFHVVPMVLGILLLIEMGIVSVLNATIHDDMHLFESFWGRFWFFSELVYKHNIHHLDTSKNLGIFYFGWDRVFGSFKKDRELP